MERDRGQRRALVGERLAHRRLLGEPHPGEAGTLHLLQHDLRPVRRGALVGRHLIAATTEAQTDTVRCMHARGVIAATPMCQSILWSVNHREGCRVCSAIVNPVCALGRGGAGRGGASTSSSRACREVSVSWCERSRTRRSCASSRSRRLASCCASTAASRSCCAVRSLQSSCASRALASAAHARTLGWWCRLATAVPGSSPHVTVAIFTMASYTAPRIGMIWASARSVSARCDVIFTPGEYEPSEVFSPYHSRARRSSASRRTVWSSSALRFCSSL
jgi:hypothetical protein